MAYINLQKMAFEAFEHIDKKEFSQAESKLSYLLNVDPINPTLYYYLGCLFLERKQYAFSTMAYEKALEFQPNFDECLNNAANAYRQLGQMDKCIEAFTKAVEIARHPNYLAKCNNDKERATKNLADYIGNLGSCYVATGNPHKTIEIIKEALEVYPNLPNGMWNIGLAYLEAGDYKKGFEGYDCGERVSPAKDRSYHGKPMSTERWVPKPLEEGQEKPIVVVYGEQGIGDEIMFASVLPDAMKDAEIILECHPRLIDIFRESFPDTTIFGTRKSIQVQWAAHYKIDYKIAIGSLCKYYRQAKEDFPGTPYLRADSSLKLKMQDRLASLSDKPKIGLSWKGGIGITNKGVRCIPLELLKPLFDFDVDFISLQYHSNAQAEVDKFVEATGGQHIIHHWQDVVDDYDLTAALLTQLDMVISVPQSVVHLAGALGVKTIQLCPKRALWQMGPYGENMPWYSSVENIWQKTDGDWAAVVSDVVANLIMRGYRGKNDANY